MGFNGDLEFLIIYFASLFIYIIIKCDGVVVYNNVIILIFLLL